MFSIVIPVHNQPELLLRCVESVRAMTAGPYTVTLVNDGSDDPTTALCEKLYRESDVFRLIHHETALGFTASVNHGIRGAMEGKTTGDVGVQCLLNTDTEIGTRNWDAEIAHAAEQTGAEILGVLSNFAGVQSVPREGDLLAGQSPQSFAQIIEQVTERRYPAAKTVHGFCYIIRNSLISRMGLFNAEKYPHYGSEDEYTFQALSHGARACIVDSVFVYHKACQSYRDRRESILAETVPQFFNDWGSEKFWEAAMFTGGGLSYIRAAVQRLQQEGKI